MAIVMKFGGSSLKNAERIQNACRIINSRSSREPMVVCSAVGGITDKLIESAMIAKNGELPDEHLKSIAKRHQDILNDLGLDDKMLDVLLTEFTSLIETIRHDKAADAAIMDRVQSFGERFSCRIVAEYLKATGTDSVACDAWDIGMITNNKAADAEPLQSSFELMKKKLSKVNGIPIITGFIGKTEDGIITTMGRGGSDYTAALIGKAVSAEEVEIWTDVNGIMSSDPRVVPSAKSIGQVSFAEASELAYFGAKVLHPKTILPAMEKGIPVRVLNTYEPDNKGTVIVKSSEKSTEVIKAIACKKGISLMYIDSLRMLNAHGFLAKVFDVFADYNKSVDTIATSEVSISLTVDKDDNLEKIAAELSDISCVAVEKGKATIGIVGEGMRDTKGLAGKIFAALGRNDINVEMISQGASEINVSFVIDEKDADRAVRALHKEFFGD